MILWNDKTTIVNKVDGFVTKGSIDNKPSLTQTPSINK